MRVKICGITRLEDALNAAEAGADAIGLNFVAGPRRIDVATAARILDGLPPFATPVALVRLDESGRMPPEVAELLVSRRVAHVQLYGSVTGQAVAQLGEEGFTKPLLVARVQDRDFAASVTATISACGDRRPAAIVLDAYDPSRLGGTGQAFCWPWVMQARDAGELDAWPPVLLAGGLNPDNVAQAVAQARPWGVDVSSGVESAEGHKAMEKMIRFVETARAAARMTRSLPTREG